MRNAPHLLVLLVLVACSKSGVPHDASAPPDLSDVGISSPGTDTATPRDVSQPQLPVDAPPPSVDAPPPLADRAGDLPGDVAAERSPNPYLSCASGGQCSVGEVCMAEEYCFGDNPPSCQRQPADCFSEKPQCGCDLVTYATACGRHAKAVGLSALGPCLVGHADPTQIGRPQYGETLVLLPGKWGGAGAQMEVSASGVTFQLPCGTGEFVGKPILTPYSSAMFNSSAPFSWQGSYRRTGAPAQPATFSGRLWGLANLDLTVSAQPGAHYGLTPNAVPTPLACPNP
jgi:hypothetical protein